MARLPKRELESIIKRDLPGYRLMSRGVEFDAPRSSAEPDEVAPDIDALRHKFLGGEEIANGDEQLGIDTGPNTDDEIVAVQPDKPGDPFDRGSRPKKVVVSGRTRRVIGSQG
jgi:hypothetical protein